MHFSLIVQMRECNDVKNKRIFTCIEEDPDVYDKENIQLTTNESQALSYLEEKVHNISSLLKS